MDLSKLMQMAIEHQQQQAEAKAFNDTLASLRITILAATINRLLSPYQIGVELQKSADAVTDYIKSNSDESTSSANEEVKAMTELAKTFTRTTIQNTSELIKGKPFNQDVFIDAPPEVKSAAVCKDGLAELWSCVAEDLQPSGGEFAPTTRYGEVTSYPVGWGYDKTDWQRSPINRVPIP